jgi:hypothetical protein
MLSDSGRCQQDPLGLQVRPHAGAMVLGDLVPQVGLEHGDVEFFLAEQGKFAAVLQAEKVGQPGRADAFGAGGG